MTPDALLNIMTVFVAVAAVALVIQVVLLFVMFLASMKTKKQVTALVEKLEPLTETSQHLLDEVRDYAGVISTKTTELIDLSHKQLVRLDEIMGEASSRTRTQMDRIEMVLDDTVNRFQETTTLLQNGILRPLKQLNALTAGIRAAVSVLSGDRRRSPEQATHDEEMFI